MPTNCYSLDDVSVVKMSGGTEERRLISELQTSSWVGPNHRIIVQNKTIRDSSGAGGSRSTQEKPREMDILDFLNAFENRLRRYKTTVKVIATFTVLVALSFVSGYKSSQVAQTATRSSRQEVLSAVRADRVLRNPAVERSHGENRANERFNVLDDARRRLRIRGEISKLRSLEINEIMVKLLEDAKSNNTFFLLLGWMFLRLHG